MSKAAILQGNIQMVDLKKQYQQIKSEIDAAIHDCIDNAAFINGPQVSSFAAKLADYLDVQRVVPCANGTDALQIALMALDLQRGDEIIVPAFTYVATAEVIGLLGLVPVMVDVDPETFNISVPAIEKAITPRTRAIVPVHLYGQCADMEAILELASLHGLFVVEDTAQAIGADYIYKDGRRVKAGTIGTFGCTSFFPSKNLGCYGDGGALYTNDAIFAEKAGMIANHGQSKKYHHRYIGCNSRLDTIQAAILEVKLSYLDAYSEARNKAAILYDTLLADMSEVVTPVRSAASTHVFHQYTLRITNGDRDALQAFLKDNGVPSMIYYPLPLNEQEAFKGLGRAEGSLPITVQLCKEVLSLPMHTELTEEQQVFITDVIKAFFKR
ncbi:DegT/DnrJ/EryC1/StrS family aminotransferase [Chitinophaga sp. B61]|uniref:DegT/DnrJ/EryC1/StrS family aminotransferase n=2 Tax=Chitinophaga rhizophila TaxID=2866212 RepID=A0ABS7GKU5_9BACT|nr:DegT/DnrJ/EryC1/StrS family aminotransferase [Chitinophaga rhizophila]